MSYGHGPYSNLPYSSLPVAAGGPPATQFIDPSGIASAEAFGVAILDQAIYPTGIASLEAFGATVVSLVFYPTGIASLEAFGAATVNLVIDPTGIASAEAFGDATVIATQFIDPSGVGSAEAFGVAEISGVAPAVGGGNNRGRPRVRRRKLQRIVRRDGVYTPDLEEVAEGRRPAEPQPAGTAAEQVGVASSAKAEPTTPRPPLETVIIAHYEPQEHEQILVPELVDVDELAKLGRQEAAEVARYNAAVLAAAAYLFE